MPVPDGVLSEELELLALLEEAGLEEGAAVHAASVGQAVRSAEDSDDLLLRLAIALNEIGRTREAIELGWELRRRGRPWDRTLARIIFPFPYQDLVTARAEELGLDPYLVAGLIRQESAFAPAVVSSAGTVGLMQVLPGTGKELAGRVGPRGFRAEFLKTPELNVHLGTTYLARLMERYEGASTSTATTRKRCDEGERRLPTSPTATPTSPRSRSTRCGLVRSSGSPSASRSERRSPPSGPRTWEACP